MPKPAKPQTTSKTEKPNANINAHDALKARRHRQEMDDISAVARVLEPAPTPAPTPTDDNNGSNVTTPRGKNWNDALENYYLNN